MRPHACNGDSPTPARPRQKTESSASRSRTWSAVKWCTLALAVYLGPFFLLTRVTEVTVFAGSGEPSFLLLISRNSSANKTGYVLYYPLVKMYETRPGWHFIWDLEGERYVAEDMNDYPLGLYLVSYSFQEVEMWWRSVRAR